MIVCQNFSLKLFYLYDINLVLIVSRAVYYYSTRSRNPAKTIICGGPGLLIY